jgi:hypothetical protein
MFIRFIIFGILGIMVSLIVSAVKSSIKKRSIVWTGEASLILFPIFGFVAILYPLIAIHLGSLPWYSRGIVYVIVFSAMQFFAGWLLGRIGLKSWKCTGRWSLGGYIDLADLPLWFILGLVVEWSYPSIRFISETLGQ